MINRYLVGIDLGTTHTVVAYVDTVSKGASAPVELLSIDQLVAPGEVAARSLLPSLRYHPAPGEFEPLDIAMPWPEPDLGFGGGAVVGELARVLGARVPGRLVASAKSWLSHPLVDRMAPILPWGATEDVSRISPLGASASYLAHVRACWNLRFPGFPLEAQAVVLTVPASFDEAARALTVEAARIAGLAQVQLLEEPQAACYDWLSAHRTELASALAGSRLLLVCDVGGGTTDFTLIKLDWPGPQPQFFRVGVGNHLMLGGDNMDLALAHVAEGRMQSSGARLDSAGLSQLVQQCRVAKERLLANGAPDHATVSVLGTGTKLVGGARSTALGRDEVRCMVADGFFPRTAPDEYPHRRRGGIVEFGLPYVGDPAVTRHLAAFLRRHEAVCRNALGDRAPRREGPAVPDSLLINGGVFRSSLLLERLLATLADWRGESPIQLHNDVPDVAVARGAVAYGLARRGRGIRIGGGSARSYFLVVPRTTGGGSQGVCLLPKGSEEGSEVRLGGTSFALRLGEPVKFHLMFSNDDTPYHPAEVVDIGGEAFAALPPVASVLSEPATRSRAAEREVRVELAASLTAVGTLELSCLAQDDPERRWQLAFDVRRPGHAMSTPAELPTLNPRFPEAAARLERVFGRRLRGIGPGEVKALRTDLEKLLGPRDAWDMLLLRELFGALWDGAPHRRRSRDHERVWVNLVGYCLRPGFGYPLDDWRVQQVWSLHDQGLQYTDDARLWAEWWTLWRRLAGGLDRAAQERLLNDVKEYFRAPATGRRAGRRGAKKPGHEDAVRMVATLERLPAETKVQIATPLVERLGAAREPPQSWWAVGRLGARVPFYGSAHNVVPASVAERWINELLAVDWRAIKPAPFAATLIARRSGDRQRDLRSSVRAEVIQRLRSARAVGAWVRMVSEISEMNEADEKLAFGESLPSGLRLIH
jgi:hypothetical protein